MHERHQDHGEQDQQQAEPVDAERVVDAEGLIQSCVLGELHAAAGVVLRGDRDADGEREHARRRAPSSLGSAAPGASGRNATSSGADERHQRPGR